MQNTSPKESFDILKSCYEEKCVKEQCPYYDFIDERIGECQVCRLALMLDVSTYIMDLNKKTDSGSETIGN